MLGGVVNPRARGSHRTERMGNCVMSKQTAEADQAVDRKKSSYRERIVRITHATAMRNLAAEEIVALSARVDLP